MKSGVTVNADVGPRTFGDRFCKHGKKSVAYAEKRAKVCGVMLMLWACGEQRVSFLSHRTRNLPYHCGLVMDPGSGREMWGVRVQARAANEETDLGRGGGWDKKGGREVRANGSEPMGE